MKKIVSTALCGTMVLGLAACSSQQTASTTAAETTAAETTTASAQTLTSTAEGFGGDVTVTLTKTGDRITECIIQADAETPSIGGAALEELQKQIVDANGFQIDGVSGATVTSNAVKKAVAEALGESYEEETKAPAESAAPAENVEIDGGLQIGLAYGAAHGTKCFTEAYAVVQDDVIVAAYLDEFQFIASGDEVKGVPNSDADFAQWYAEGVELCSKRENSAYYSKLMAEKGGSTVAIDANFDAIQNYAVGKTIEEIETLAGQDGAVDAVSGATLVDTAGYLQVIADAAKNAQKTQAVAFAGDSEHLKLNVAYSAAHGTKGFTAASALTDGDEIILSYLDEFQFIASGDEIKGVPNSDADFAEGYAEGVELCSKRENSAYYSKLMAEKGGAANTIAGNFDAIQAYIDGMTVEDAEALAGQDDAVDAVSGATLVDTAGYIAAIVNAAK